MLLMSPEKMDEKEQLMRQTKSARSERAGKLQPRPCPPVSTDQLSDRLCLSVRRRFILPSFLRA